MKRRRHSKAGEPLTREELRGYYTRQLSARDPEFGTWGDRACLPAGTPGFRACKVLASPSGGHVK